MLTNLKNKFKSEINKNNLSIKSLKNLHRSKSNNENIKILKQQNSDLKKTFKENKKEIFITNKKEVKNINIAIKNNAILLKENKCSYSFKEFNRIKLELSNLKERKKSIIENKYRIVYGTSTGKMPKDKLSLLIKIAIVVMLLVLFISPFWIISTFSTKNLFDATDISKFSAFKFSNNGGAKINYDEAIQALDIWNSLFTTLVVTIVSNLFILLFASMAAWQLVRYRGKTGKIIFSIFIISIVIPFQAIMLPMMALFTKVNINQTILGVTVAYVGVGMATSIFMLHGFLKTVPTALEESAVISGMIPFHIYIKIVLPLLKTTFATILILNVMWIWNDYLLPSLFLSDTYGFQTLQVKLIDNLVSSTSENLRALSAGVVILVGPPIIFFIFAQKKMISGITNGAIK